MRILVCPSGFKGSLQPDTAADCIEAGILAVEPNAIVRKVPLVDGGEGFTVALTTATGGTCHPVTVTGPMEHLIESFFGLLGRKDPSEPLTAVVEMAAAAGLSLVPSSCRDPGLTTTYGVGQLILAALDTGAERILVGCGDSGTCDGGAGMLQALGARLLDDKDQEIPIAKGGESLDRIARIDLTNLDPRVAKTTIDVAVNWHNVLCGPQGVAAVFGPQKGATVAQVNHLSRAMEAFARAAGPILGVGDDEVRLSPGSGASGGLGTGLRVIGATLRPRFDIVMEYIALDGLFDECDLVVTAEGGIDDQTPRGKIPGEIARRAKRSRQGGGGGLPVIAIAGTIGSGARVNYDVGIDAFTCILQRPTTLDDAVSDAERLTRESAESVMRIVAVGRMLGLNNKNNNNKRSTDATASTLSSSSSATTMTTKTNTTTGTAPTRGAKGVAVSVTGAGDWSN